MPAPLSVLVPVTCEGDMIATLEVVLYWLVSSATAAFIGLAVIAPQLVERSIMDILTRIVTAVAGN
jgi:hypothetical protein